MQASCHLSSSSDLNNIQFNQLLNSTNEIDRKLDSIVENQKSLFNLLTLMDAHICTSIEKSATTIAQAIERRIESQTLFVDNRIKQEIESVCEVMLNKQKDLKEKENKEQQTNAELHAFEEEPDCDGVKKTHRYHPGPIALREIRRYKKKTNRDVKSNAPCSSNCKIDEDVAEKKKNTEEQKEINDNEDKSKAKEMKEQQINAELRAFEEELYRDVKSNATILNCKIDDFVEIKVISKEKEKEDNKKEEEEIKEEKETKVESNEEQKKGENEKKTFEINEKDEKDEKIKVEELIVPNIQPNAYAPMNPNDSNSFIQVPVNGQIMLIPVQHQPDIIPQNSPIPSAPSEDIVKVSIVDEQLLEDEKLARMLQDEEDPKDNNQKDPNKDKRVGIDTKAELTADGKCPICNKDVKGIYRHISEKHNLD